MEYPVPYRPGIPIPPERLRYKVTGFPDAAGFHYGGKMTLDMFRDALQTIGRDFPDYGDIYDFGCGCGRLTPWFEYFASESRLSGSDIDAEAVDWLQQNFPRGEFRVNDGLPPLPFPDAAFDLVIGYSVFTHLDAKYQDAWLTELRRVARPGAILLLTANLERSWQRGLGDDPTPAHREMMESLRAQIDAQGILFRTDDEWGQYFPAFYHTTWHAPWYIRAHWSQWFTIEEIIEGKSDHLHQATIVLRREASATNA